MKTSLSLLRFPVALAAFAALVAVVPAADTKKPAPKPADLQVLVNVPPTWRPFLDDDIAETLFYRLKDVFRRRGYSGELAQVTTFDAGAKDVPTLQLNLTEWRVDRIGNAQCTLSASLKTAVEEKNLGLATGTALLWVHGNRWSFTHQMETANALEDAADSALREVYDAVAKAGVIPGIPAKK